MNQPQLVTVDRYHAQLLAAFNQASRRILIETMSVDGQGQMSQLIEALILAAQRGVDVKLIYDRYSYLDALVSGGLRAARSLRRTLGQLEMAGVKLDRVGAMRPNPFSGRHHAKAVIVDGVVYTAGGINFMDSSFSTDDYMWRFDDLALANQLYDLLPRLARDRPEATRLDWTEETAFLIDGGVRGQSIIYDQLCDMAEQAEHVYYVSKLMPDAILAKILRHKSANYWFNTLGSAPLFDKPALLIDEVKGRLKNNYTKPNMLHAKLCLAVMPDGSMAAVSGSHNFNYRGVKFGTQELAIYTRDQYICQQLLKFVKSL